MNDIYRSPEDALADFGGRTIQYDPINDEMPSSVATCIAPAPSDHIGHEAREGVVPLGHDRGTFYYLSLAARQVYALTPTQHGKNALMAMASVPHHWERTRFRKDKGGIDWDAAIADMMQSCRDAGIYDPDRLRGRGAWIDQGRAVLHTGDRLIVDGAPGGLMLAGSRHIYEAAKPLADMTAAPLSNADAHKLVLICKMLRFERGLDAVLLAGFLAVAPVCGGLAWRPSIWLTGAAGSGKSWTEENVIAPALGGMALQVQSKTSEAGIRQALGSDARPVLFGEAEAEDAAAAVRMQGVLDLVRQSASEGGAEIIKGSQDQRAAKRYRIRSCFLFSSINVALQHHADESRVTVLGLRAIPCATDDQRTAAAADFERLKTLVATTITPDFSAGLLARSTKQLGTIRANAETFAQAVGARLGSRRMGDQIGTLLAGAWSLHASREIGYAEAVKWLDGHDWDASEEPVDQDDERRLLAVLTQHRLRVAAGGAPCELTVGRLIQAAFGHDDKIGRDAADAELRQIGIRVSDYPGGVHVSNNHPAIKKMLIGTPWANNWHLALSRLPDAQKERKNVRFAFGHQSKSIFLPTSTIEPEGAA